MQFEAAVEVTDEAGRSEPQPALQRELFGLSPQRRHEPARRSHSAHRREAANDAATLVELEIRVDRTLTDLTRAAVIQSVRAGYDEARIFRVSRLARNFAEALGMNAGRLRSLQLATSVMDIGNMGVSDRLLRKPCELSPAERVMIDGHAALGAELLVRTGLAMLEPCVSIVRFHHERWDGAGPCQLAGRGIPHEARVASLCDAFDALTHGRPWRPALTTDAALRTLESESSSRFDPELCALFVRWAKEQLIRARSNAYFGAEAADTSFVQARRRIGRIAESSVRQDSANQRVPPSPR